MVNAKNKALNAVIASRDGLHLTVYLVNNGSLENLRLQIDEALDEARDILGPLLTTMDLRKFLAPLMRLRKDSRTLRGFSGNIGFFRTENWSRTLNLPVQVEPLCIVADTFHTKPLLRWMQQDQEFLLVNIGDEYANLFWGNRSSFEFVDSLAMHRPVDDDMSFVSRRSIASSRKAFLLHWVNCALAEMGDLMPEHLFIGSKHEVPQELIDAVEHPLVQMIEEIPMQGVPSQINFYRNICRDRVQSDVQSKIAAHKVAFAQAETQQLTVSDFSEIARLAAEDRIETLFIAGDREYFGRINKVTGSVDLNPMQTDHLDDDVLDDIAQIAQQRGARVIVMEQDQIPGKNAAAAIIKPKVYRHPDDQTTNSNLRRA